MFQQIIIVYFLKRRFSPLGYGVLFQYYNTGDFILKPKLTEFRSNLVSALLQYR